MSDIRRLLESLDKLAEQGQPAKKVYDFPTQQKLPIGTLTNVPAGKKAFNMMGQELTKPVEPTQKSTPAATTISPGQKSLPLTLPPSIEPETPAYTPKQPWLDPKGSKEPAYMRKAAGETPPQPLGVIGGTGPDAKFAKAPTAANEPVIPKTSATVIPLQKPSFTQKVQTIRKGLPKGSEYTNVYAPSQSLIDKGNKPSVSFADQQYAKDIQRELEKTPDDPNLKAELELLQTKGIVSKPQAQPGQDQEPEILPYAQPQTKPEDAVRNAMRQGGAPFTIPTTSSSDQEQRIISPLKYGQQAVPGMTREFKEFTNFIDTKFPIKSKRLKEQTKGPIKSNVTPLEFPPGGGGGGGGGRVTVTPGPVPRVPANVDVPAYQRTAQPGSIPPDVVQPPAAKPRLKVTGEPSKVAPDTPAANAPLANPPQVFKQNPERARQQAELRAQDVGKAVPGEQRPLNPPEPTTLIPTPSPGKPGSVTKQTGKLIPPAVISSQLPDSGQGPDAGKSTGGGGGGAGGAAPASSSKTADSQTQPIDVDKVMWVEPPSNIDLPQVQGPITPGTTVPKDQEEPSTMMVPTKPQPQKPEPEDKKEIEPELTPPPKSSTGKGKASGSGSDTASGFGIGTGVGPGTGAGTGPGFGLGTGGGVGSGTGSGAGSGTGGEIRPSPLKYGQEAVPGMTRESLSRKFYNQFKNFMLTSDGNTGKSK